ncbi:hypothetical protein V5799_007465 [Amblyomma americanum]|uniref:Uncharacterized protein n=1 Tax=Amblyomma americanum TaxID=6943 RepID=A0AAQ4FHJ5_AMBAM
MRRPNFQGGEKNAVVSARSFLCRGSITRVLGGDERGFPTETILLKKGVNPKSEPNKRPVQEVPIPAPILPTVILKKASQYC